MALAVGLMPSWLQDGSNTPLASDNEWVLLCKWADSLYQMVGNVGSLPFPEGSRPLPTDGEERLEQKINAMTT